MFYIGTAMCDEGGYVGPNAYDISYFEMKDGETSGPDKEAAAYWDLEPGSWSLEPPPDSQ